MKEILERIHFNVFPRKDVPKTLRALVEALGSEEDPFEGYSHDKTRAGAAMAMTLALAHDVEGDFEKATSTFPTGAYDEEVDLKPFSKRAKACAKTLAGILERRLAVREAAERQVAKREAAAKGVEASESAV